MESSFGLFGVVESGGGMYCFVLRCSVTSCCMVWAGSTCLILKKVDTFRDKI